MSQTQAKMQLNWNLAQKAGDTGNGWDEYKVSEALWWDKLPKDMEKRDFKIKGRCGVSGAPRGEFT